MGDTTDDGPGNGAPMDDVPHDDTDARIRLLERERDRARTRIASLTGELASVIASAQETTLDDEHDPDGATVGFERAQLTALLHQAEADLVALDEARERLGHGTYGICDECGQPIPADRLAAIPTTTTCVPCASKIAGRTRRRH